MTTLISTIQTIDPYDRLTIATQQLRALLALLQDQGCDLNTGFNLPHKFIINTIELAESLAEEVEALIPQACK
ncbi:hypothetical protein D648_17020 [Mannheimia haemolytica USDA-ARS-USMARC-185]|uniref:hypothetical protein n=1 Tax=Mannheimia haemolytica TaxID=75985 RepID=UPI0002C4E779|nr:hypothetical protein [Mannheimia haemolytica]AGI35706.1 hypothetical protein D648_17020 [Mannheimia haemolytica USDA-ARS-USMARC-185]